MHKPLPAVFALTLCAALTAQAAPAQDDELSRLLVDRGLIQKIEQFGQRAADQASELVMHAMGFLGVPYRRGGNSLESGFDCSGFVRAIYSQTLGLVLPRSAHEQAEATERIDRTDLRPGDLVFFNTMRRAFSHVGIYVGNGKFIHAPSAGGVIRVEDMGTAYWSRRFDGARRVAQAAADLSPGNRQR